MHDQRHGILRGVVVGLISGILVTMTVASILYLYRPVKSQSRSDPVTFSSDIAPIIFAKCSGCHCPNQSAPFSLLTYDDVRSRARQIVEVTQSGFMPPWLPEEGHGDFLAARRLTESERQMLKQWVEQGTPCGDPVGIPPAPELVDSWEKMPPDLVIETPGYKLSSQERDVFRNFVLSVPIDGPRWVESIEIRPFNPRVTHHARLGVDSSNESTRRDAEDADPGYEGMAWGQDPDGQLVIWAPGMAANPVTPGVAWRLHPQTTLVLHTHMQPTGKTEEVKFRVGIRFAKAPPEQYPAVLRIGSCDIDIPAGTRRHVIEDQYTIPIDIDLHSIFPHAHSLCREIEVVALRSDGSRELLISIKNFDENWHDAYRYRKPIRLPQSTRLHSRFVYDNSNENVRNRNRPARRVVYGSNSNDEMADVYLQVTAAHPDQRAVLMEDYKRYQLQSQVVGYRRSLELYPDNPWSQEGLATAYIFRGETDKAISILEQRLKSWPRAVFPVVSLGMALLASGDAERAEEQFRQATLTDGKYSLAWFGLAKALASQKKTERAEQMFRRAVELTPRGTDARLALADLLIQRGALDEAKEICSAALDDSPDMANVNLKLAEISAKQKRYDECLKYCQEARRLAPYTHPAKVLLAVFCFANGENEYGKKLLREAREESPDHPIPELMLGQLARQEQKSQEALEHFNLAAALLIPNNWPQSHQQRFRVLLQTERFQLAQQLQDIDLALDSLDIWRRYEPANLKLQEIYRNLKAEKAGPTK
ncbi:MAG: tetratricopeptide repeat protein [Planctomycetota bacterium]|nr:tetratricopeptide repeat protein [Planctomycetota bacterium]